MSGRPTQFASKTGVGTVGLFLCSNALRCCRRRGRILASAWRGARSDRHKSLQEGDAELLGTAGVAARRRGVRLATRKERGSAGVTSDLPAHIGGEYFYMYMYMCVGGPAPKAATRVAASTPPLKHLDIFKGAPLRLPTPLSDQFPVRVRSCPLCT